MHVPWSGCWNFPFSSISRPTIDNARNYKLLQNVNVGIVACLISAQESHWPCMLRLGAFVSRLKCIIIIYKCSKVYIAHNILIYILWYIPEEICMYSYTKSVYMQMSPICICIYVYIYFRTNFCVYTHVFACEHILY